MSKVEIEIRNVYYDNDGKPVDKIGERRSVDPVTAERLVSGGAAVFATKTAAKEAGVPDAPTSRTAPK